MKQSAGQKIKKLRIAEQMTQKKLATLLGTTRQTISRYENGKKSLNQDVLFKLGNIFKTSINEFFPPIHLYTNKKKLKKIIDLIDTSLSNNELEQLTAHIAYIKCKKGK